MLFHCILAFKVYVEKKAVNLTGRGFPSKSQVISSLLPSKFSPYFDSLHFYYDASFVDILELILLRITEFPDVFRLAFFSKLWKFSPTHSLDFFPSFLSWLPLCICWYFSEALFTVLLFSPLSLSLNFSIDLSSSLLILSCQFKSTVEKNK